MKLLVSGVFAAVLLGGLEGWSVGIKFHVTKLTWAVLVGAGLAVPVGVCLGLVGLLTQFLARKLKWKPWRRAAAAASETTNTRAAQRSALLVRFFEISLPGAVLVLPSASLVLHLGRGALNVIQDPQLAADLNMLFSLTVAAVAVLASWALSVALAVTGLLRRVLSAENPARVRVVASFLAWFPAALWLGPLVHHYRDDLGAMGTLALQGVILLSTWALLYSVPWSVPVFLRRGSGGTHLVSPRQIGWVCAVVGMGTLGLAVSAFSAEPALGRQLVVSPFLGGTAGAITVSTDLDRDGASSLLADGDCAPLDPDRGPHAADVPGNGLDEDCDGEDARALKTGTGSHQVFLEQLPKGVRPPFNIVWVVIDAVRADALGKRVGGVSTTPELDALQRESLSFSNAFSNPLQLGSHSPAC